MTTFFSLLGNLLSTHARLATLRVKRAGLRLMTGR